MKKIFFGISFIIVIALLGSIAGLRRHWCPVVGSGGVFLNETELEESASYACSDNSQVSFLIDNGEERGAILIDKERQTVSYLTETRYIRFDSGMLTLHQPPTSMIIGSIPAKTDTDPQARFSTDDVSFQIQEGKILRVKLVADMTR